MTSNPPMPEPMCTPTRGAISGVTFKTGGFHGFIRGRQGQVDEAAHLLQLFFLDELQRIEILDLRRDLAGELRGIKLRDAGHAAFAGKQVLPDLLRGVSHRRRSGQCL